MAHDSWLMTQDGRNGLTIAHWRSSLHSSHNGCSSPRSIKNLECTNSFLHFRQLVFSSEAWDFWVQTSQSTSCPSLMYSCLSFSTIVPHMPLHRKVQVLPVEGSCNLKRSNAWWPSTWRSSRRDLWRLMGGMTSCTPHLSTRVKRLLLTTLAAGFGTSGGGVDGVGAAATSGDAAVERKKRCWASSCTERSSLASSSSTVHMGRWCNSRSGAWKVLNRELMVRWMGMGTSFETSAAKSGGANFAGEPCPNQRFVAASCTLKARMDSYTVTLQLASQRLFIARQGIQQANPGDWSCANLTRCFQQGKNFFLWQAEDIFATNGQHYGRAFWVITDHHGWIGPFDHHRSMRTSLQTTFGIKELLSFMMPPLQLNTCAGLQHLQD